MLRRSVLHFPQKEALVHRDQHLTYEEVGTRVARLADGLRQVGLQRGDRIGIYLDPSVAQVVSIFGISQAGGVFVPINNLLFPDQVTHIARDCGMKGLITTSAKLLLLAEVLKDIPSLEFLVVVGDELPETSLSA